MLRENLHFEEVLFRLEGLMVYKSLRDNEIIKSLADICRSICYDKGAGNINEKFFVFGGKLLELAEENGFSGNILKKYVIQIFLDDVNAFTLACERNADIKKTSIYQMAYRDIDALKYLMNFDLKNLCENLGHNEKLYDYKPIEVGNNTFPEQVESLQTTDKIVEQLIWYYNRLGCGDFARYKMFKYDDSFGLVGIKNADNILFSDIIGYDEQKTQLRENTEAFLSGKSANNVLLAGVRGSGKSSCVKALANEYFDKGLRLIDISKEQANYIPCIVNSLAKRGKKIIIFIDDLSYDDFEAQQRYLKSIIEGSTEIRPSNVLLYATSNKCYKIIEKCVDKETPDADGETRGSDTLSEKISLSDKFGTTVTFPKPNRATYLKIVAGLAKKENITIPEDFLLEQAIKWETNPNRMSGRTAKQFISHIQWELKKS